MTPLEFLLGVMRDADTPANLRLRIASLLTGYLHPRHSANGAAKIVVEDPTGFSVDPARARELRDAKHRYDVVYSTRISQPEHYEREAAGLLARIEEIELSLECPCPSLYGKEQLRRDHERLQALSKIRHSGLKLSAHEDIEEAWLTARIASWRTIPDGDGWARLRELDRRRWDEINPLNPWNRAPPLSAPEKAEFRALQTLYQDHGVEVIDVSIPDCPGLRNLPKLIMEMAFAKYPLVDSADPSVSRAAGG
jgi:hypothetical protein